ncbi:IS1182 family transposase [Lactobacillus sp. AN1001]
MLHKEDPKHKRCQYDYTSLDDLVPKDHLLRKVDQIVDFSFIYDLVEDSYCKNNGRPSLDPVLLIKIPLIQYLFGIRSMRQTIKEIQVNVAYRWFLGLGLNDPVPHFTTYGKNYVRRFAENNVIEEIFEYILQLCQDNGFIDTTDIFIDGTHIKAGANNRKYSEKTVEVQAKFLSEKLEKEINIDRKKHGKKPLKPAKTKKFKAQKISKTDPDSGWFHKGEHKQVFAYNAQVACDKNGWVLAYSVDSGNIHDTQMFPKIFDKIKKYSPSYLIADTGYKTPTIVKFLLSQGITPVFPYKRPGGKKGKLRPKDFVYDEYYDCFLCPNDQVLKYSTTNRDGYREYKSDPHICKNCQLLQSCTESKKHQRIITRHIWHDHIETCEDIRHQTKIRPKYKARSETIERLFGSAKEYHNMRYAREIGKSKIEAKVGLTLACLNLKKLVKMLGKSPDLPLLFRQIISIYIKKDKHSLNKMRFVFNLSTSKI